MTASLSADYDIGGAWPLFASAEADCIAEGFDVVFAPDSSSRLFVEIHSHGESVAEALIAMSSLEEMPRDVRDWTLAKIVDGLLLCTSGKQTSIVDPGALE